MSAIETNKARLPNGNKVQALDDLAEINTNVFAIISDGGKLLGGTMCKTKINTLKDNGFEHVNHSEDFLNALAEGEYAIFLPVSEEDIQSLGDETNMYGLPCSTVELLLNRYKQ